MLSLKNSHLYHPIEAKMDIVDIKSCHQTWMTTSEIAKPTIGKS